MTADERAEAILERECPHGHGDAVCCLPCLAADYEAHAADARREAFGEVKAALRQLQREYIDLDCKSAVAAAQNRIRALDERENPDAV